MSERAGQIKQCDHNFKIVIIGNSNVGKSSLLLRFADDKFDDKYLTTIGVDFKFKTFALDGQNIKLQIWDTAGQERFRTITSAYYKGADGIILVYDTTNQQSFDDVDRFWMNEVDKYAQPEVNLVLLGNKCDEINMKNVQTQMAEDYAKSKNMQFNEVSAKLASGINEAFMDLVRKLIQKNDTKKNADPSVLKPISGGKKKKDDSCC